MVLTLLSLLCCVATTSVVASRPSKHDVMGSKWLEYYNVTESVNLARIQMQRLQINNTKDRLAAMVLYSFSWNNNKEVARLRCALSLMAKNLQSYTTMDIFLWVRANETHLQPSWLNEYKNMIVLPLSDVWQMPDAIRPEILPWTIWSLGFSHEYRFMGHWRLAFSFPFVRDLGYEYLLQIDSDTYMLAPVKYDLVAFMREKGFWMTNKDYFFYEIQGYTHGLPELARYWIVTRYGNDYTPPGPLYKHCRPPNIDGVFTNIKNTAQIEGWNGWDAYAIAGNLNIFSIPFWFQTDVQDFLHIVLRSGGHIEQRWVDVLVQSMIGQMFVPEDKFHVFKDMKNEHNKIVPAICHPNGPDVVRRPRTLLTGW